MVDECCVRGCPQTEENLNVMFHKFPRKYDLKQIWLNRVPLRRDSPEIPIICSDHFLGTDYKCFKGKKILNSLAIPSVFDQHIKGHHERGVHRSDSEPDLIQCNSEVRVSNAVNVKRKDNKKNNVAKPNNGVDNADGEIISCNNNKINSNEVGNGGETESSNRAGDQDSPEAASVVLSNDGSNHNSAEVGAAGGGERETKDDSVIVLEDNSDSPSDLGRVERRHDVGDRNVNSMVRGISSRNISAEFKHINEISKELDAKIHSMYDIAMKTYADYNDMPSSPEFDQRLDLEDNIPSFVIKDNNLYAPALEFEVPLEVNQGYLVRDVENLEVSVDPTLLMMDQPIVTDQIEITDSDGDKEEKLKRNLNEVSLLTSSDEDDVILEEPVYDLIEVSDETDEEDKPLVRLIQKGSPPKPPEKEEPKKPNDVFHRLTEPMKEFYCITCNFLTRNQVRYLRHLRLHKDTTHICSICNYSSRSATRFKCHMIRHTKEKKYTCTMCAYTARHQMSLLFHYKNHTAVFKCDRCKFETRDGDKLELHRKIHARKNFLHCKLCLYKCKNKSTLLKHQKSHSDGSTDSDE